VNLQSSVARGSSCCALQPNINAFTHPCAWYGIAKLLLRYLKIGTDCSSIVSSCADESEQVAIIEGACALLLGQPMYRLYARQPAALATVAAALMNSSGHQSPKAVQALSQAFITFAMGFIRPPMLDYCQVGMHSGATVRISFTIRNNGSCGGCIDGQDKAPEPKGAAGAFTGVHDLCNGLHPA